MKNASAIFGSKEKCCISPGFLMKIKKMFRTMISKRKENDILDFDIDNHYHLLRIEMNGKEETGFGLTIE